MYELRTLEEVGWEELAEVYNLAFSDYVVPMQTTPPLLEAYCTVSGVVLRHSFGAFCAGRLVGFLVNAVDRFGGKTVAYDAMTGIVPEHRGQGLFSQLFAHTRASLKASGITHYTLEVISSNSRAYQIYQRCGARVTRELAVLSGSIAEAQRLPRAVQVLPLAAFPARELCTYEPTFGNRYAALARDLADYQVAYLEEGGRSVAAVFSSQGRVMQLQYGGEQDRALLRAVLSELARRFASVKVSNIPLTEAALIQALLDLGLELLVQQYEMYLEL